MTRTKISALLLLIAGCTTPAAPEPPSKEARLAAETDALLHGCIVCPPGHPWGRDAEAMRATGMGLKP